MKKLQRQGVGLLACLLVLVGCAQAESDERPQILVTTTILGDVVNELVQEQADVKVLMPVNADPHSMSLSAPQAASLQAADLVVSNGAGLEEGLASNLEQAGNAGTRIFAAADHINLLSYAQGDHAGVPDPHFWTDPQRMDEVVEALHAELHALPEIDVEQLDASVASYRAELDLLDQQLAARFALIDPENRVLLTNHHVFGYLADRYGFRVLGAVVPGGSTLASPSAADLRELVGAIEENSVSAIFAETSQPETLIRALAKETSHPVDVQVLFTESLSAPGQDAETYLEMMRANAQRISQGLSN